MGDPQLLADSLRDQGLAFRTDQVAQGTLHGTVDEVRVTLLEVRYPLLAEPIRWPERDVSILSLAHRMQP